MPMKEWSKMCQEAETGEQILTGDNFNNHVLFVHKTT